MGFGSQVDTRATAVAGDPSAASARRRRRGALIRAISVVALVAGAVAEAPVGVDDEARRAAIVIGENIVQPVAYSQYEVSKRTSFTMEDEARLPGFPVRQHPVNVGRFDAGCAQCHRLAGPLPADSGAPEDVFDRIGAPVVVAPAPAGFERITTSAGREEYPSWSPDGTALLYEAADAIVDRRGR